MKIRVSIADDHPVVINGLQKILSQYTKIELGDMCSNGSELLQSLEKFQPDVLLLDIQMPGINGEELAKIIHHTYPSISILTLTNNDTVFHVKNMMSNGAIGYLLKSSDPDMLIKAIETVYKGEQYIDPIMKELLVQESIGAKKNILPVITLREKEILELIVHEYSSQEIAEKLSLSHRTIENHRLNLLFKFGVKNVAGLVRKAIQLKLVDLKKHI